MRQIPFSIKRASLLLIVCCLLCLTSSLGQQNVESFASGVPVLVDDYLESLSDNELRQICTDRGFEIVTSDDSKDPSSSSAAASSVTRGDLLDAARRCLSLEDEMNAILAEHPELAAELDREIERMRQQKEQLEKEREEILVQKALLERQLQDAGVDIGPTQTQQSTPATTATASTTTIKEETGVAKIPETPVVPDTLEGVLKESFRELYERVMQDVRLVQRILSPVTKQLDHLWQFVWKYAKPVFGDVYDKVRQQVEAIQKGKGGGTNKALPSRKEN